MLRLIIPVASRIGGIAAAIAHGQILGRYAWR